MIEFLIAFGAGLISFLSPCVLPLIPGYVSFISGQSLQELLDSKQIKFLPLKKSLKFSSVGELFSTETTLISLLLKFIDLYFMNRI